MTPEKIMLIPAAFVLVVFVAILVGIVIRKSEPHGRCSECGRGFEFFEEMPDGRCTVCHDEQDSAEQFMHEWDGVPSSDMNSPYL
jgi:predicted amidophosphoribosyltransferase